MAEKKKNDLSGNRALESKMAIWCLIFSSPIMKNKESWAEREIERTQPHIIQRALIWSLIRLDHQNVLITGNFHLLKGNYLLSIILIQVYKTSRVGHLLPPVL